MKIYKFLTVDNQDLISDKIYDYIRTYTTILDRVWKWNDDNDNSRDLNPKHFIQCNKELEIELKKIIDHEITLASIIYIEPRGIGDIHIDHPTYTHRILWPIRNCKGSYTKFYDLNGNNISEKKGKYAYNSIDIKNPLIEIESVELTKPIIFNTQIPHGIYTNPEYNEPRLTATFGFGRYPLEKLLIY